jgi:histidine triad (HIT) family protein
MEKDIFCKIIDREIPCHKIYEDDDVLAFLDISQATKGHTLVVSKKHYDNFLTTPQEEMHKVMDVAQRIGQAEMSILGAKGVNILTNVGEPAGQSVMHFHVHVIPRYLGGEGGFQITMKGQDTSGMDLPRLAMDISKALKK